MENDLLQLSIAVVGLKTRTGEEIKITIGCPVPESGEHYCMVSVEGVTVDQRIYAEDAISALINSLTYLRTLLDPPPKSIRDKLAISEDPLSALSMRLSERRRDVQ